MPLSHCFNFFSALYTVLSPFLTFLHYRLRIIYQHEYLVSPFEVASNFNFHFELHLFRLTAYNVIEDTLKARILISLKYIFRRRLFDLPIFCTQAHLLHFNSKASSPMSVIMLIIHFASSITKHVYTKKYAIF